jgi:manganese oxidase
MPPRRLAPHMDSKTSTTTRLLAVALLSAFIGAGAAGFYNSSPSPASDHGPAARPPALATGERAYDLTIQASDIDMGAGTTWHAWTFDGQVPGPTLTVTAGQTLKVTVHNRHHLMHSFHTHLTDYGLEQDGSQLNLITGQGLMAMIPAGASYTYTFRPMTPGLYYYHCHSADGGHPISQHMAQGLYGAIHVLATGEPPVREEVLFMTERGFDADPAAPFFLMNGMGIPGGEHTLETIFAEQGAEGVVAQFGKTVPVLKARVGETVRLSLINIGDAVHSFHLHGNDILSVDISPGNLVPANVVQLVPGGAERVLLTAPREGLWLFHCHVVSHADAGMIGVFVVEPATSRAPPEPISVARGTPPAAGGATPRGAAGGHGAMAEAPPLVLDLAAGAAGQEFRFTPEVLRVAAGATVRVLLHNEGQLPHTFTVPDLAADTGTVPARGEGETVFRADRAGTYEYLCTIPGHAQAGMRGRIEVG